jgi:hypothetical protein
MMLHLITLCMGLIIAVGLQQIVELWMRRRRDRKARRDAGEPRDSDGTEGS